VVRPCDHIVSIENEVRRANWLKAELKASLQALAMPPLVQIDLFPEGVCIACELTGDFENFSEAFIAACEEFMTSTVEKETCCDTKVY
jgi:hypothetical protein